MEKIERQLYGILVLLGGIFLFILMVFRLVDFFSRAFLYFILIFFIVLALYGVILILFGILIIGVNIRVKKSVAFIIFKLGILIILLSITMILVSSFNTATLSGILSGICLFFLGLWLFYHKKKVKAEREKNRNSGLGIFYFIIGLLISVSHGLLVITMMVSFEPEYALYSYPVVIPFVQIFLIGINILVYGIYSIRITPTTQDRRNKFDLPILRVTFIILIILYIISLFLFTRGSLLS